MKQPITEAHKYQRWVRLLKENGLTIHGIEEIYTRHRHNGEALFSVLMLDATTPEGDPIPPIVFLKGQVVSVLICLIDRQTGERFLLLVRQRRICSGGLIYECVAGMVDNDEDPLEVARREAEEEAGIQLTADQIIPLGDRALFPTTGTSDESIFFFYTEIELDREQIMDYHERKTGVISEHERIVTYVASIPEAKKLITNTNGLLNIFLYEEARAAKKKAPGQND